MVPFKDSWAFQLSIVLVGLFLFLCWQRYKALSYWKTLGVPSLPIDDLLFGNVRQQLLKRRSWFSLLQTCYDSFKGNGFGGIYLLSNPVLVICDPKLVEKVLFEDFAHFENRFPEAISHNLLSDGLIQQSGEKWRSMRSKLLPAFTSGKVKGMFPQVFSCCNFIMSQITDPKTDHRRALDIESIALAFVTESIASCSFGIQIMSDPFERRRFRRVVEHIYNPSVWEILKGAIFWMRPNLLKFLRLKALNSEVAEYFFNMTRATIQLRNHSNVSRDDFLQLMMHFKKQEEEVADDKGTGSEGFSRSPEKRMFTEDCIASQMFNLINAGSTPTKITISFILFEMAKNINIQLKVQKEIDSALAKHKGWKYEALKDMKYVDQVIQETLRLHTYTSVVLRTVTDAYCLPGTQVMLRKGSFVHIPIAAIHMDPQFYPSPETFDPDRFADNHYKPSSTYLPFGHGPRICISIKFAVFMVKLFVARILAEYDVGISSNMKLPFKVDQSSIYFHKIEGGIWLTIEKRGK